ncbi:hypothetical protein [Avrilella dinanensis]|uniref:hypothetical protein n=1 Tax=Avrilella dinanensis TaxID=2008672 RepID=UPI002409BDA2|nr:hypothetical protein [Avrilella dinanensis]
MAEDVGILTMKVLSEKLLSDIYEKQNNVEKALLHYKKYAISKDSLTNYENIRKSVQSEMTFEFEKRESLHKKRAGKERNIAKRTSKKTHATTVFRTIDHYTDCRHRIFVLQQKSVEKNTYLTKRPCRLRAESTAFADESTFCI